MRNKNKLLIKQLDQKLAGFTEAAQVLVPQKGWINTIRTTLNMTRKQLATRLWLTPVGIQKIEEREAKGQITLNKLRDVAKAMDMQMVYGFVPKNGTIENLIDIKAKELARKIVMRTHHNMILEDQGVPYGNVVSSIDELANEIKREMRKSLWD